MFKPCGHYGLCENGCVVPAVEHGYFCGVCGADVVATWDPAGKHHAAVYATVEKCRLQYLRENESARLKQIEILQDKREDLTSKLKEEVDKIYDKIGGIRETIEADIRRLENLKPKEKEENDAKI